MQWLDRGSINNSMELDVPTPGAVGVLVALVLLGGSLSFLAGRRILSSRRLLTVYLMLTIALPFCSVGLIQGFYSSITAVAGEHLDRQIGTIGKGYESQTEGFYPKIPAEDYDEYIRLFDENSGGSEMQRKAQQRELVSPIKRFWAGKYISPEEKARYEDPQWSLADRLRASWAAIPWHVWRPALPRWGLFFALALAGSMLLTQILCRDWTQRENLPFPVAQLPLSLMEHADTDHKTPFPSILGSPFFLTAFAVGAALLLVSGLSHYRILNLQLDSAVTFQRVDFNKVFTQQPWTALKPNVLFLSPVMIGLAYMVHQEILRGVVWTFLSLQFVRLMTGAYEKEISTSLGTLWKGNRMPYYPELAAGAVAVFAIVLLWRSRRAISFRSRPERRDNADGKAYLPAR
jgi:hypothetical protein